MKGGVNVKNLEELKQQIRSYYPGAILNLSKLTDLRVASLILMLAEKRVKKTILIQKIEQFNTQINQDLVTEESLKKGVEQWLKTAIAPWFEDGLPYQPTLFQLSEKDVGA
jgi:hypothetical protein